MQKADLIKDLNEENEDCFTIFSKGYLEHFDLTEDIFVHVLPKLIKESNDLMFINTTIINTPHLVSDLVSTEFKKKAQDFYDMIQELFLDQTMALPFIANCCRILADKASPSFLKKVKNKIEQGYTFQQSSIDGSLTIKDPSGNKVFESAFIPMNEILKELGIDISHNYYALFYFGIFPKNEIYTYRLAHSFRVCFQF